MAGRVNWHGTEVLRQIEDKARRNLEAACIVLANAIKRDLGRSPGPPRGPASAPGEVPHYRTTDLLKSIIWETERLVGRVGHDHTLKYGPYVELGTQFMAPRPHLRPALDRLRAKLLRILSRP